MQTNPENNQNQIQARIRTLRTLWLALFMTIGMYFFFTIFVGRPENRSPNTTLFIVLLSIGILTTLLSFLVKNKLLSRAVDHGQVGQVQQAYVIAWALTEVAALLGMLDFFGENSRFYFVFFIISASAQLLHFPRSEHVMNASFKKTH